MPRNTRLRFPGSLRHGVAAGLLVLLVGPVPALTAQGHPGMAWTLLPGPGLASVNPAFELLDSGEEAARGLALPVGLLGLIAPERNPLLYWSDRDRFREAFDLLSCFEQVAHLDAFLINPPRSPDTVAILVERGRLELSDGEGNPLPLVSSSGYGALAVAGTPLVPPPLVSLRYRLGPLYLESGLFLGSEGCRFEPNPALKEATGSGQFLPDSLYALSAVFSAVAGLSQSVSLVAPLVDPGCPYALYGGLRLVGFYTAARAAAEISVSAQTDGNAIPASTAAHWNFFYLYPGGGGGGGVRLDLGLALEWEALKAGVSVLNLAGASWLRGYELVPSEGPSAVGADGGLVDRDFAEFAPAVIADASLEFRPRGLRVVVGADIGYVAAFQAHAGACLFAGPLVLRAGAGWNGGAILGASAGARWRRLAGEVVLTSHPAVFTGERVYGIGLHLTVSPAGGRR